MSVAPLMALGVMGSYFFMLVPVVESALVHSGLYTASAAGLIGSAPLAGMFVGSIACAVGVDRLRTRLASTAALLGLLIADLVSAAAFRSLPVLLGAQFTAGCAGIVLMSLTFAAISRTPGPDRYFAIFIACQMSAGALATQLLQRVALAAGPAAVFGVLAVIAACALSLVPLVANAPSPGANNGTRPSSSASFLSKPSIAILTTQIFFGAGVMLIWSCAAVIGESRGLSAGAVANALSASLIASVAGALCASWVARWWPARLSLLVGSMAIAAAAVLVVTPSAASAFNVGVIIFGLGWNFLPSFQLGVAAAIDPSGRLAVLSIALVKLGYAAGTAAAGWLAEITHSYAGNATAAVLFFAIALAAAVAASPAQRGFARHAEMRTH